MKLKAQKSLQSLESFNQEKDAQLQRLTALIENTEKMQQALDGKNEEFDTLQKKYAEAEIKIRQLEDEAKN